MCNRLGLRIDFPIHKSKQIYRFGHLPTGCNLGSNSASEQSKQEQQNKEGSPPEEKVVEKTTIQIEIEESKEKGIGEPKPKSEFVDRDCGKYKWYGGVGIQQQQPYGLVVEVYKGYPAERMGIQVGDYLLNLSEIRGEVGSEVEVRIERNGKYLSFKDKREKICVK